MKSKDALLLEMYDQWRLSQDVVRHVRLGLELDGSPRQSVEAALENAIMAVLLDLDESAPVELFRAIGSTPEHLNTLSLPSP